VTGDATLSTSISQKEVEVQFVDPTQPPTSGQATIKFSTPLRGAGDYRIRYANCDDRIYLWINDQAVPIPGEGCYSRSGKLQPFFESQDFADARPLGIGFQGGELSVGRLKVFRDIYYLGKDDFVYQNTTRSSARYRTGQLIDERKMFEYYENPAQWVMPEFQEWFAGFDHRTPLNWGEEAYRLAEDQFFPMGDNSPQSEDARKWNAPKYVERRFMIGRALAVYWPHTWNSPLYWPNFNRMRVIH
jgi:signal peptidase I